MSTRARDAGGESRFGETFAEALTRDRAIEDIDWTVPAPGSVSSRFAAPSGELAVVSLGDPGIPRVVLVPGVTGSKEDFVLMLPLLAEAGYYVQSYDLAGQYESAGAGPADGTPYGYDLFYDDLVAFLESGAPAHLLGYSFAGTIAQLVVTRRPELVRSLALMTTSPDVGNGYRGMKWIGPFTRFFTPHAGASLLLWGIDTNRNKVPPGRLAFVRSRFDYTRRDSIDDIVRLMKHTPDLRDAIRASDIPKLVIIGEHDLWPVNRHAAFAERIGAELAVYDTGHSPCETTPHQLTRDLLALYAKVDAG